MSTGSVSDLPGMACQNMCMNRLKEIREARGLTQEQLAERIATTGASISRYENQDIRLTLPLMRRLGSALHCSVADLAGETASEMGPLSSIDNDLWDLSVTKAEAVFKSASEVAPLPRAKIMAEVIRNTYDALATERARKPSKP